MQEGQRGPFFPATSLQAAAWHCRFLAVEQGLHVFGELIYYTTFSCRSVLLTVQIYLSVHMFIFASMRLAAPILQPRALPLIDQ